MMRMNWFVLPLALLLVSAIARISDASLAVADDAPAPADPEPHRTAALCPPSREVAALVERLESRDAELSRRARALTLRERDVEAAAAEAAAAIDAMEAAGARLEARMARSATASAEDLARLTAVYEGMKPKDAATLFEAMDPDFAAGFLARMRPEPAAAIFSNLAPTAAYALSVVMAGRNAAAATE